VRHLFKGTADRLTESQEKLSRTENRIRAEFAPCRLVAIVVSYVPASSLQSMPCFFMGLLNWYKITKKAAKWQ
jgi:hypothetical protein